MNKITNKDVLVGSTWIRIGENYKINIIDIKTDRLGTIVYIYTNKPNCSGYSLTEFVSLFMKVGTRDYKICFDIRINDHYIHITPSDFSKDATIDDVYETIVSVSEHINKSRDFSNYDISVSDNIKHFLAPAIKRFKANN